VLGPVHASPSLRFLRFLLFCLSAVPGAPVVLRSAAVPLRRPHPLALPAGTGEV